MSRICRSHLYLALTATSSLAAELKAEFSPVVAAWQSGHALVIASSDNYRQYEFHLFLLAKRGREPVQRITLLHERVLGFDPRIIAAASRALSKDIFSHEVTAASYDDDATTLTFATPNGLTIGLKATESKHRDYLYRLSHSCYEEERSHSIGVLPSELLKALPKPKRGKARDHTHITFASNNWRVSEWNNGDPIEIASGQFDLTVNVDPAVTLNLYYLREALEMAKDWSIEDEGCIIELGGPRKTALIRCFAGANEFRAYTMPIHKTR